jgi:hypothetical protein
VGHADEDVIMVAGKGMEGCVAVARRLLVLYVALLLC